ncbi:MAG: serine/threonine protein kinase [Planctomycetales bacterium]|nr:serine/threonine protein kinase [Planctomycetales bacterium]
MDTPTGSPLKAIFGAALEIEDAADRYRYLDEACQGDASLRSKVDELLQAYNRIGDFLASPLQVTGNTTERWHAMEREGSIVGRYKLLEKIGEGGFGLVFMAAQQSPVKRQVAVKVLRPGVDSEQVIARFEAERQALALMDHPHIAKIFDAGITDSGRPYFAMELVRGTPVTAYCDDNCLSVRKRLAIFSDICDAVQHAHQKGIIHRDLKPANIMITSQDGKPVVKIIDFGIAKAIDRPLTDRTVFTRFGQMVGTPLYMSPEQTELSALEVDTRTDIYSLGVVLYELLTGSTPLDKQRMQQAAENEVRRIIQEEEPPRPSLKLSTLGDKLTNVSHTRQTDAKKLVSVIRGDLDWIVMKTLEKDRTRRYSTATGLAQDVWRYLKDEPVEAGPPSTIYRLRKFARRNRLATVAGTIVTVSLLVGLVGLTAGLLKAERERKNAQHEAAKNRRLLYASDMGQAQTAWEDNNVEDVRSLLLRHVPRSRDSDLRRFEWYYLWNQCSRAINTPVVRLSQPGVSAAFSTDGNRLAAGGFNQRLEIFDIPSLRMRARRVLARPEDEWVMSVAYSPDGRYLAVPSQGGDILLFDQATGQEHRLKEHGDAVNTLAFSPDGQLLGSGSDDQTLVVWDVTSLKPVATFSHHEDRVYAAAFLPDGSRIVSVDSSGVVTLSHVDSQREPLVVADNAIAALYGGAIAVSPDGREVAFATNDNGLDQIVVAGLAASNDAEAAIRFIGQHADEIRAVTFVPHGDTYLLATGSRDNTVRLWEPSSGQMIDEFKGHAGFIQDLVVAPDGNTLASIGRDSRVRLWELHERRFRDIIDLDIRCVDIACVRDSGHVLALGVDGRIRDVDLVSGVVSMRQESQSDCYRLVASGDGRVLLRASHEHLELATQDSDHVRTLPFPDEVMAGPSPNPMVLTSNGENFAVISVRGAIYVGDAERGVTLEFAGHDVRGQCIAIHPTKNWLATADQHGTVFLWDMHTGKRLHRFVDGEFPFEIEGLAFSPDGRHLFVGSDDNLIRVWDLEADGATLRKIAGHTGPVKSFLFADDGQTLISAAGDGQIIAWDLETDTKRFVFTGERTRIEQLAWLNAHTFVSLSGSELRVWQAATAEQVDADFRLISHGNAR